MTEAISVYITCESTTEAERIADTLLEKQLIACANILPGMKSRYRWKGKVESSSEAVLVLKSLKKHYQPIEEIVLELHSYDCPCLLALPVELGSKSYLDWIAGEVL